MGGSRQKKEQQMRAPKSKIKVDVRSILRERVPAGPAGRPRLSLSKMDQTATLILDFGALIFHSFFCLEPPMGALICYSFFWSWGSHLFFLGALMGRAPGRGYLMVVVVRL